MISITLIPENRIGIYADIYTWPIAMREQYLNTIKEIPGRKWNNVEKRWEIPLRYLNILYQRFKIEGDEESSFVESAYRKTYGKKTLTEIECGINGLFGYQKKGIDFLSSGDFRILGDDMGLGKTIMSIGACVYLRKEDGLKQKVLIICPSSLKEQWKREIKKWIGEDSVIIDGDSTKRDRLIDVDSRWFIVNYEKLLRDKKIFQKKWDVVICDECSRVKNIKSKVWKMISYIDSKRKWGLSGTPIVNNVMDLYGICECLHRGFFGLNWWEYRERYCLLEKRWMGDRSWIEVRGYKNLDILKEEINSIFLRRKKSDKDILVEIGKEFGGKLVVNNYRSELSSVEKKVYEELREIVKEKISRGEKDLNLGEIVLLKEICDDVRLIVRSESPTAWEIGSKLGIDDNYVECHKLENNKLNVLKDILKDMEVRKIVIFTQFKKMAEILKTELEKEDYGTILFTGGLDSKEREKIINEFNLKDDIQILISTDAGGYGLNLQVADVVINYDLPWTIATIQQRIGRVYRLGQQRIVNVINIVSTGTIEEHILDILTTKKKLIDTIVEGKELDEINREQVLKYLFDEKNGG